MNPRTASRRPGNEPPAAPDTDPAVSPLQSAAFLLAVGAAVLTSLSGWLFPDAFGVALLMPPGRQLALWTRRAEVVAALGLLLVLLAGPLALRSSRRGVLEHPLAFALAPLILLPLSYLGFHLAGVLPAAVPPNLLFFVPVLLVSLSLCRWLRSADRQGPGPALGRSSVVLAGAGVAALYALVGWHFTVTIGPAGGDEGHYILMAESLSEDGDLDLRNKIGARAERDPGRMHVSPFSRGGRLYSWHPIGLPLLLAPLFPLGAAARHVLLGLLSGLCAAGVVELCRVFGVRRRWSLAVLLLFALSTYWGVYSSRCLPEVAGAALAAWGVAALLRQRERPWGSGWLCVACCAYLPWLHERFLPVSGAIFALYLTFALARREERRAAARRLVVLSLAYGAALAGYAAVRFAMFAGGLPLRAGDFLFSYPLGMWHAVASDRGVLAVLPLFAALLGAATWVALRDPANRRAALAILAVGAVALATSCSHPAWFGGATHPGRFLVVVLPLFIPGLARALERGGPVVRWWSVFLGLIPCFLFLLLVARLGEVRFYSDPRAGVSIAYDHLNGLVEFFDDAAATSLHPFALVLLGGTGLLFFAERRWGLRAALVPAVVVLAALAGGDWSLHRRLSSAAESVNARRLTGLGARLESAKVRARGERPALGLFEVSDLLATRRFPPQISSATAPAAANDWAGRGYRWIPVAADLETGAGWRACRLSGRAVDATAAHWAVREGGRTLLEEPLARRHDGAIDVTARLRCDGSGPVSVLVRFAGDDGALREPSLSWSPFSSALLASGGLSL